jgi:hypothetical protein
MSSHQNNRTTDCTLLRSPSNIGGEIAAACRTKLGHHPKGSGYPSFRSPNSISCKSTSRSTSRSTSYYHIRRGSSSTRQKSYKYDEKRILKDIRKYIDYTYNEHYSQNKIQATEFIIDAGHGDGFCIGNIMKYAQRYGKKNGKNTKDLLKIIHYAIMLISANHTQKQNRLWLSNNSGGWSTRSTTSTGSRSARLKPTSTGSISRSRATRTSTESFYSSSTNSTPKSVSRKSRSRTKSIEKYK